MQNKLSCILSQYSHHLNEETNDAVFRKLLSKVSDTLRDFELVSSDLKREKIDFAVIIPK